MRQILKQLYNFLQTLLTLYYCFISGLKFNSTFKIRGRVHLRKGNFMFRGGELVIGDYFIANSKIDSNSIGVIQPVILNFSSTKAKITIGNNVGISGSTLNAATSITIGNNVMIGSGCIISDTDSHSLDYRYRNIREKINTMPINIGDNVFIGARSIVLKGVTIGQGAVIGAGSVVVGDVLPFTVYAGNPAVFIKNLNID
jgi:acetyltransferase-like isoleucine patch superfamily enzyme